MLTGDVFKRACHHAESVGILDTFLKFYDESTAHFVGHGVGLDLNEPPFLSRCGKEEIEAGMVLAIELHLYDSDVGMIKLEDMILVQNEGCRMLTGTDRELTPIWPCQRNPG